MAAVVSNLPQELQDHCIDLLAEDVDDFCLVLSRKRMEPDTSRLAHSALLSVNLTSRAFCHRARSHLFRSVGFSDRHISFQDEVMDEMLAELVDRVDKLFAIMTWKPSAIESPSQGIAHGIACYVERFGIFENKTFTVKNFTPFTERLAAILDALQQPTCQLKDIIISLTRFSVFSYFHEDFRNAFFRALCSPRTTSLQLRGLIHIPDIFLRRSHLKTLILESCEVLSPPGSKRSSRGVQTSLSSSLDHLIVQDQDANSIGYLLDTTFLLLPRLSICIPCSDFYNLIQDVISRASAVEFLALQWLSYDSHHYELHDATSVQPNLLSLHKLKHLCLCFRDLDWKLDHPSTSNKPEYLINILRSCQPPPRLQSTELVISLSRQSIKGDLVDALPAGLMAAKWWPSLERTLTTVHPFCTLAITLVIHIMVWPSKDERTLLVKRIRKRIFGAMPLLASATAPRRSFDVVVLFNNEETPTWSPVRNLGRDFDAGFFGDWWRH